MNFIVCSVALLLILASQTFAAADGSSQSTIDNEYLGIKVDCPSGGPILGNFSYVYEVGGEARFALGAVKEGKLSADIALSADVDGVETERKISTAAVFSAGNWTISVKVYPKPFPNRLPVPVGESITADSKYINALYDPINSLMPPAVIEMVGEANNCESKIPDVIIEVWRGKYSVLTLHTSDKRKTQTGAKRDAFLAFIKGYYSESYGGIFSIPPEVAISPFEDGFRKLYYYGPILDAVDARGVIDVAKVGQLCVNREGNLLTFNLSGQDLFTMSISTNGSLSLYAPSLFTDIPTDVPNDLNHEADSTYERRLVEFGDYIYKYFDYDGPTMGIGNPYALHLTETWYYIAVGKLRVLSRLGCR